MKLCLLIFGVCLIALGATQSSCSSACPLRMVQRIYFPTAYNATPEGPLGQIPCCGAMVFQDLNLQVDEVQIDLTSTNGANGRVDAFLTTADCAQLFSGPYPGGGPLCKTYLGPVSSGSVSQRVSVPPGRYRLVAQGYTSNESVTTFLVELGLWSDSCRISPAAP